MAREFVAEIACDTWPVNMSVADREVAAAIARLLGDRKPEATICPSEVARALSPEQWRPLMPLVRSVAVSMAKRGLLEIRQHHKAVPAAHPLIGPIRLAKVCAPDTGATMTPDGRYLVVRGRLWRRANPNLSAEAKTELVHRLMDARRMLRGEPTVEQRRTAREQVQAAKVALGERGPVWWTDGSSDFNRRLVKNSPYAEWYSSVRSAPEDPA